MLENARILELHKKLGEINMKKVIDTYTVFNTCCTYTSYCIPIYPSFILNIIIHMYMPYVLLKELLTKEKIKIDKKLKETSQSYEIYKKKLLSTQNILITDTKPEISWMPGIMNDTTKKLMEERKTKVS